MERQYLDLCNNVLMYGMRKQNRTGIDHVGFHGAMMEFDLADGFPVITTRKMNFKAAVGEMLCFIRGYDNAAQFRSMGVNFWDPNANENQTWLNNPNRKGPDDLGRIYGVQARNFAGYDQLKKVVNDLMQHKDDRREIISHWNPAELDKMALPPCHLLYQFGIQGEYLNLCMYQRSCDMPLGVPFDIMGYAWLLQVISHITGLIPGKFTHFLWDVHIYVNQIYYMEQQLKRTPYTPPTMIINSDIKTLEDLETWVTPNDFQLACYTHHPVINYPLAV